MDVLTDDEHDYSSSYVLRFTNSTANTRLPAKPRPRCFSALSVPQNVPIQDTSRDPPYSLIEVGLFRQFHQGTPRELELCHCRFLRHRADQIQVSFLDSISQWRWYRLGALLFLAS